jgi:hypothetical protein
MDHKGSLLCSQAIAHRPYIQPNNTSKPYLPKIHLNIIVHLQPGLLSGLLLSAFPTKNLYAFLISPMHAAYPTRHILLHLIVITISGQE